MDGFPKNLRKKLQRRWHLVQTAHADSTAELDAIDESIRDKYEHTVAPVIIDMAGFTARSREFGIVHYLAMIESMRGAVKPVIEANHGTVVKVEADNLFAYFSNPDEAMRGLNAVNQAICEVNYQVDDKHQIELSVGVGYGPTLLTEGDMWGYDFNLACKLGEDLAENGEILFSDNAYKALQTENERFQERTVVVASQTVNAYSLKFLRGLKSLNKACQKTNDPQPFVK